MSSERGVKSTSCSIMRSRASNSARIDVRSSSSAAAESSLASCALSGFCKQAGGGKVRKRIATIQTHLAYLRLDHQFRASLIPRRVRRRRRRHRRPRQIPNCWERSGVSMVGDSREIQEYVETPNCTHP